MPAGVESPAPGSMSSTWRVPAAVPSLAQSSSPLRPSFIAKYTESSKRTRPLGKAPRNPGLTAPSCSTAPVVFETLKSAWLIDGWYATKSRRSPSGVSSRGSARSAAIEAVEAIEVEAEDEVGGACSAAATGGAFDAIAAIQAATRSSRQGTDMPRSKADAADALFVFTVLFPSAGGASRFGGRDPREPGG